MPNKRRGFVDVDTAPVYDTLNEAPKKQYRQRKTLQGDEAQQALENLRTQGQKGLKSPRINLAFRPSVYDFVHVMSAIRGQAMTEYINEVLAAEMERNRAAYEQAKALVMATTVRREG